MTRKQTHTGKRTKQKETTQINNTINLLSKKINLDLFMACILQASQSQKKVLQNTKDRTKATIACSFPTHKIKAFPASIPQRMVPSCDSSELLFENPSTLQFSKYLWTSKPSYEDAWFLGTKIKSTEKDSLQQNFEAGTPTIEKYQQNDGTETYLSTRDDNSSTPKTANYNNRSNNLQS
jgi:hypothetical protein